MHKKEEGMDGWTGEGMGECMADEGWVGELREVWVWGADRWMDWWMDG